MSSSAGEDKRGGEGEAFSSSSLPFFGRMPSFDRPPSLSRPASFGRPSSITPLARVPSYGAFGGLGGGGGGARQAAPSSSSYEGGGGAFAAAAASATAAEASRDVCPLCGALVPVGPGVSPTDALSTHFASRLCAEGRAGGMSLPVGVATVSPPPPEPHPGSDGRPATPATPASLAAAAAAAAATEAVGGIPALLLASEALPRLPASLAAEAPASGSAAGPAAAASQAASSRKRRKKRGGAGAATGGKAEAAAPAEPPAAKKRRVTPGQVELLRGAQANVRALESKASAEEVVRELSDWYEASWKLFHEREKTDDLARVMFALVRRGAAQLGAPAGEAQGVLNEVQNVVNNMLLNALEVSVWSLFLERLEPGWAARSADALSEALYYTAYTVKTRFSMEFLGFTPLLREIFPGFGTRYTAWLAGKDAALLSVAPVALNERYRLLRMMTLRA